MILFYLLEARGSMKGFMKVPKVTPKGTIAIRNALTAGFKVISP